MIRENKSRSVFEIGKRFFKRVTTGIFRINTTIPFLLFFCLSITLPSCDTGGKVVLSNKGKTLTYRCGKFESKLNDFDEQRENTSVIIGEVKRYLRFLDDTERKDQAKELREVFRKKGYFDLEKAFIECLCNEDREQMVDRRRWMLEDVMTGKPVPTNEEKTASKNERQNPVNSPSGQKD